MSAKHTKGPWQWDGNPCNYDKDNEAPWLVTDAYAVGVERDLRRGVVLKGSIDCPNEADARLIASAPELLEALQKFVTWSKAENDHKGTTFWERVEMLRDLDASAAAAIAKATGEQA